MFIQTENTPNPNAIKFLPGNIINPDQPLHFDDIELAEHYSPIAFKLLNAEGITAVFLGYDFITVTKKEEIDWLSLKPEVLAIIMDHLTANLPILSTPPVTTNPNTLEESQDNFTDLEKQIIEILDTRIRPSVAMDGGDIIYRGFKDGVVQLELRGACSGCPSSVITLKHGIESMLKHFVPEVEGVEAI